MRPILLTIFIILSFSTAFAQRGKRDKISNDIFNNHYAEYQRGNNRIRQELKRDIFGYLEYRENNRQAAYLKKDIFDNWIFTDKNKNELKYSKEFWADLLRDYGNNDENIFLWQIEMTQFLSNYKEEYKVDIFDHLQFKNNQGEKASLSKDIFDNIVYEDSKGNKLSMPENMWNRKYRRHTKYQIFMSLVQHYLFND